MDEELDLGDGHKMVFQYFEGERSGIRLTHPGCVTQSWIPFEDRAWSRVFDGRLEAWKVVSDDPLTLEPSIQCRACGDHGHIRNGRWERA